MPKRAPTYVVVACLGLASIFFGFLGFHSYVPYDPGFVLAYSWRVFGGQDPYIDFLHLRPPLSIYLHTGWLYLPEAWSFPASRLGYFVEMALAASLPTAAAIRVGLVSNYWRTLFLTLGFYIFALGSFPVMPWYTVDGVLFSSIALACWLRSTDVLGSDQAGHVSLTSTRSQQIGWRSLSSLALAAAALCKQPFSLLPLAFALCVGVEFFRSSSRSWVLKAEARVRPTHRHHDWALLVASLLPGLILAIVQVGVLFLQGAFSDFIDQVVLSPLQMPPKAVSWFGYLSGPIWFLIPGVFWPWLERQSQRDTRLVPAISAIELLVISALAFVLSWDQLSYTLLAFLLGQGLGRLLGLGLEPDASPALHREELIRVGLGGWVILTGFSASLSWGASTPALGLAALGIALAGRTGSASGFRASGLFAALLALVAVVWFAQIRLREPYLLVPLSHQTEPIHEVFPRFGRLWGTPELHAQMSELKNFHERYATEPKRPFVVLRNFPLIHYLTDTQSTVSLDWYYWLEMRGYNQALNRELRELDGVIIIERPAWGRSDPGSEFVSPCEESIFSNSPYFLQHLYRKKKLMESGRYFCIFENRS